MNTLAIPDIDIRTLAVSVAVMTAGLFKNSIHGTKGRQTYEFCEARHTTLYAVSTKLMCNGLKGVLC